jgi:hypothetical protein
MCQLILLGSVEPLPECNSLQLRAVPFPGEASGDCAALQAVLPEARHLYALGGCQCYFRYHPEVETAACLQPEEDKVMADTTRSYLQGCNAFVARTADYLEANLVRTPIWLVWKWEGQPVSPDCERWTRTPSYFRQQDFTMPNHEGVITLVPDADDQ